jgi:hypothetical protein
MKTFQKIILASAISAAPFASQAMEALDDSVLGNTTGQAGVTIEIDLGDDGIKVGSVVYTDTAHTAYEVTDADGVEPGEAGYVSTMSGTDGGSVALENININLTGKIVQTIDVSETGDLVMTASAPGVMAISAGNDTLDTTGAFSALKLQATDGSESEIVNNLSLDVTLGKSTTTIKNLGNAGSLGLGGLAVAGVQGAEYQAMASSMAIQMTAKAKVENLNVGLFGYTSAQATSIIDGKVTAYADGYALAVAADTLAGGGSTANVDGYTSTHGATVDTDNDGVFDAATATALTNQVATGSAIQVSGVSITDANSADGMFSVDQTIWAVGGDASEAGSTAGVYIQMGAMNLDVNVAGIGIGGHSIGSVAINGLELNGLTQRIYGH